MKKIKHTRNHEVRAYINNLDLTKVGTSISLKVYDKKEKIGEVEIGRGSLTWFGRNRKIGTPLTWSRFADLMESV